MAAEKIENKTEQEEHALKFMLDLEQQIQIEQAVISIMPPLVKTIF